MCGRYSLTQPIQTVKEHFQALRVFLDHSPRYNLAPSQTAPVVIEAPEGRELHGMRWGLIPAWARDEKTVRPQINARAETAGEKPTFRASFRNRRCLVPADGFFEWQARGGTKHPQYIHLPGRSLFAFAGLWSEWKGPEAILRTFAILTTSASDTLRPVHDRMPVILAPGDYAAWLASATPADRLQSLLEPFTGAIQYYEIGRLVNSPKNDSPECLDPVTPIES